MVFFCCTFGERAFVGCTGKDINHALAGNQKPLVDSAIGHFTVSSQFTQYFIFH
jgi:hypothetical protein